MSKPKRNPNQRRLGLERSDDEAKAVFDAKLSAVVPEVAGVSDAVWQNVAQLLESLFFYCDREKDRYAEPTLEQLIGNADLSSSVLGRTKTTAKNLGLITTERPRLRRGQRRKTDRVWIHHDNLDRLVELSRDARRVPSAPAVGRGGKTREHVGRGGKRWEDIKETSSPPPLIPSIPPPTPSAPPASGSPGQAELATPGGWGEVLRELQDAGVHAATAALDTARRAGASPHDVLAILAAWREGQRVDPPAWGPGLLATKVKRFRPGDEVTWPHCEPLEELRKREAREEQRRTDAAKEAKRRRRQEADAASKAAERQRTAELEAIARSLPAEEYDRLRSGLNDFDRDLGRFDGFVLAKLADQLTAAV